jgi:polyisoprenoid-binding protein YceI
LRTEAEFDPSVRSFGPQNAACVVLVFREGLLAPVGHDLLLRATSFAIHVADDERQVSAEVDATSLRVLTAMRDGRPLPAALRAGDARDIEATILEVLGARKHPTIRFASSSVTPREGGFDVDGRLTLAGATRPVVLPVRRAGDKLATEVRIHQPEFGIRPYTALLGAVRVRPDVVVKASLQAGG